MKEIQLSQGLAALVDDEDFEHLNSFKWHANKGGNTFYAMRNITVDGKQTAQSMHGVILDGKNIDHIDRNGLNNQRSNLRLCSQSKNMMNQRRQENTSSIYKGVAFHRHAKKWVAYININGNRIHLGLFFSEADAARAYNAKAIELFLEFANLNIIN